MFEGEGGQGGRSFESSGALPLPTGPEGRGSLPLPADGSGFRLLSAAAVSAVLGLLGLGLFAQLTALPAFAAFLLGVSRGALLLAALALLVWWRRRGQRSAP